MWKHNLRFTTHQSGHGWETWQHHRPPELLLLDSVRSSLLILLVSNSCSSGNRFAVYITLGISVTQGLALVLPFSFLFCFTQSGTSSLDICGLAALIISATPPATLAAIIPPMRPPTSVPTPGKVRFNGSTSSSTSQTTSVEAAVLHACKLVWPCNFLHQTSDQQTKQQEDQDHLLS